ncbi:7391_t:CDS:2 [Acaulospora colombiana]|uniref:7391_t:CDS:1 n=1 Tax=Acaulospora colombiana TaxID=27376 RepID=A0ACA9KPE2_9GLOM|nr:7391_t:CDS:2 [Acaulospora colombiana]
MASPARHDYENPAVTDDDDTEVLSHSNHLPSTFLKTRQNIAASAQVFMLGVPPKLANVWFSEFGEQNFATSIGVTANNAGIAAGFLLSPWMIKEKTAEYDVPKYLLLQFGFCSLVYLCLLFTFRSAPREIPSRMVRRRDSTTSLSATICFSNINHYVTDRPFMLLTVSYGMITGGQYALSTLLAQIILPVFREYNEYATMITSKQLPDDEIATTGILNTFSQIWGIILISVMSSIENSDSKYTMELPNWVLFIIVSFGLILLLLMPAAEDSNLGSRDELLYDENFIEEIMDEEEGIER